jgi:AcrR family transcriptional regulator
MEGLHICLFIYLNSVRNARQGAIFAMSMPAATTKAGRKQAVGDLKRDLILKAAQRVFEAEGLDGASLRAIAAEAGYTPAALYFHFASKEAIYAELLGASLARLNVETHRDIATACSPAERLKRAAMGFFGFYLDNPRDLDLGFYLFRGGMTPKGLGRERDAELNRSLERSLLPIAEAAEELGASRARGRALMVDIFAHAAGLLLLAHTGRIRMFKASASQRMKDYVELEISRLTSGHALGEMD